jgi:hypothetical protein
VTVPVEPRPPWLGWHAADDPSAPAHLGTNN